MIALQWVCDTCDHVEDVVTDDASTLFCNGYDVGDFEPCIYCDGTAHVEPKRHRSIMTIIAIAGATLGPFVLRWLVQLVIPQRLPGGMPAIPSIEFTPIVGAHPREDR